MIEYCDCHMHETHNEKKGILIALEGKRGSDGGYTNQEVSDIAKHNDGIIPVHYVDFEFCDTETPLVKYHPRRENYTADEVIDDIKNRNPKGVIIDTLNQPDWTFSDYWKIAKQYPDIPFLLSHTGGFDMLQFLNIAMFQKNVWIDFSFVQHVFGFCGDNIALKPICDLIDYGMKDPRIYNKLLFGTDNMRGERDQSQEALEKYLCYDSFDQVVNQNFERFINLVC